MQAFIALPTVGILGGGQLGRMTALAAIRMGIQIRFLVPEPAGPIDGLGATTVADWTDKNVLRAFASGCTVVTVESEWAPADLMADVLPPETALWPSSLTIKTIRDKGVQKQCLREAGLPIPDYALCKTLDEAEEAAARFGYPVLFKQLRGSYDGYGNATVEGVEGLQPAWTRLAAEDGLLVEAWAPFVRELAVLVARSPSGDHVIYPVAHTEQRDHRCHAVIVPAAISSAVAAEAQQIGLAAVEAVGGVGLTAVEMFELENGQLLINELAPRPHNTGHYSIEGCYTSQFENHVRAILGWPLGSPALREPVAVMVNILGQRDGLLQAEGMQEALSVPGAAIHLYGKKEVREKRKMGHVTITGWEREEARSRAEKASSLLRL